MNKISIITVVYNSEKYIRRTIESIVGQDYPAIEYIIIDGKSKDSTMQIVNEYRDRIAVVISEPDKGLYDAMNKGLRLATGDYVLYINSGDALPSPTLMSDIFGNAPADSDVIYGDTHHRRGWQHRPQSPAPSAGAPHVARLQARYAGMPSIVHCKTVALRRVRHAIQIRCGF